MSVSYCQNHLGKSFDDEITAEDIVSYFTTERQESITLEFKSYTPKDNLVFDGTFRGIAAFLNSEGGLLILGAPREITKRDKYSVVQGSPTPIPTGVTTKDKLVDSISGNISYLPLGILIKPVEMAPGEFVYLIEVQESINKPHQYARKYPIRLDGQNTSAPHYLVESFFKQNRIPELEGYLKVTSYNFNIYSGDPYNTLTLRFISTIFNVTPAINDTDVYIQLVVNAGIFQPGNDIRIRLSEQARRITVQNVASLITDGLPAAWGFEYEVNTDQLREVNGVIRLSLIFGGRNSATRISSYSITLSTHDGFSPNDFRKTYTKKEHLQRLLVIERQENKPINDKMTGLPIGSIYENLEGY